LFEILERVQRTSDAAYAEPSIVREEKSED